MFQVISRFSDWILINQTIVFSTPFVLRETDFQKILPGVGTGAWVKIHRVNAFSRNVNIINWKFLPTHGGIYKTENSTSI